MILCPNTSPLLVLARLDRLDLLGDPQQIVLTNSVLAEVRDKRDLATDRVDAMAARARLIIEPLVPANVDASHSLGAGERSVLAWVLEAGGDAVGILDDAAARVEARRLGLAITGTLGVILSAKRAGAIAAAAPLLREALAAGLYLDDSVLSVALESVGESWPR